MKHVPLGMKLLLAVWAPLAVVPLMLVLSHVHVPQPLGYRWHKALHILGAVMFAGNIVTQALWLAAARATGSAAAIRASYRALNWTDVVFMGPGMFLLLANGAILAQAWGGIERWSWMVVALLLFAIYGVVSMPLMWIQLRIFRVLGTSADEKLSGDLDAVMKGKGMGIWLIPMLLIPVAILVIMVVKPRFW